MRYRVTTHGFEPFLPFGTMVTRAASQPSSGGFIAVEHRGTTYFLSPEQLAPEGGEQPTTTVAPLSSRGSHSTVIASSGPGLMTLPTGVLQTIVEMACDLFDWVDPEGRLSQSGRPCTMVSLRNVNQRMRTIVGSLVLNITYGRQRTFDIRTQVDQPIDFYPRLRLHEKQSSQKMVLTLGDVRGFADLARFIVADYPIETYAYVALGASAELLGHFMRRAFPGARVAFVPVSGIEGRHMTLSGQELKNAQGYFSTCLGSLSRSTQPLVVLDFTEHGYGVAAAVTILQSISPSSRKVVGVSLNWRGNMYTEGPRALIQCLSQTSDFAEDVGRGMYEQRYKKLLKTLIASQSPDLRVYDKIPMSQVTSGTTTAPIGGSWRRLLLIRDIVSVMVKALTTLRPEQLGRDLVMRLRVDLDFDDQDILKVVAEIKELADFVPDLEALPPTKPRDTSGSGSDDDEFV